MTDQMFEDYKLLLHACLSIPPQQRPSDVQAALDLIEQRNTESQRTPDSNE